MPRETRAFMALTPAEQKSLRKYREKRPGDAVYQLNQNPDVVAISTPGDQRTLQTIIKNCGILWAQEWNRWLTAH
eukprot:6115572-Alexandrium_andersonii.AAC.1